MLRLAQRLAQSLGVYVYRGPNPYHVITDYPVSDKPRYGYKTPPPGRIAGMIEAQRARYAEFLGTDNLDHVVSQALQFIFKRDSQFRSWLEQHPAPTPKPARTKAASKSAAQDGGAL